MASPPPKSAYEGVFAINKPLGISSAQVIRDVQEHFNPSSLFQPWFEKERLRRAKESHNQRQKRRSWKQKQPLQVKIGHGGTLDPMATGVLILGVGSGTKSLLKFLECTKSYEAVILFGAATDTYDAVGKVAAKKPYDHVTKEAVEEALGKFRGKIMQRPPIFSALKVQGKPLYEYAREGKEVPVEIEERPVEVESLEMIEWMDGGTHEYHWPSEEAPQEEKAVLDQVLQLDGTPEKKRRRDGQETNGEVEIEPSSKRTKSSPEPAQALGLAEIETMPGRSGQDVEGEPEHGDQPMSSKRLKLSPLTVVERELEQNGEPRSARAQSPSHKPPCPAPACRLRMTVTSGFYVRSLAHDLGATVDSVALMSSLVRSRQGDFELGQNVLEYDELAKGEEHWGPKVEGMLAEWRDNVIESGDESSTRDVTGPNKVRGRSPTGSRDGKQRQRRKDDEEQDGES